MRTGLICRRVAPRAAVLAIAMLTGIAGCGGSDNQASTTAKPNSPGTTINIAPETGAASFPQDLKLPTANDPQTLVNELYTNYQNAANNNESRFLDFFVADRNSNIGQQILTKMAQTADYRRTRPNFHHKFDESIGGTPPVFAATDTTRTATVDLNDHEIDQNGASDVNHPTVQTLTLQQFERTYDDGGVQKTANVWLMTYLSSP